MATQVCKKVVAIIALIFSLAGIALMLISEDMYILNFKDAYENGDQVAMDLLGGTPSEVILGVGIGHPSYFSCWSINDYVWNNQNTPITYPETTTKAYVSSDKTREYLNYRCYGATAANKYYIAVTAIFSFIAVIISVVSAFTQKATTALTASYFLSFSTAMLFVLLFFYAEIGSLSASVYASNSGWAQEDIDLMLSLRFRCIQDCKNQSDDKRAMEWLRVFFCGISGAVISIVANWMAISVVTFFFEQDKGTTPPPPRGTAGL